MHKRLIDVAAKEDKMSKNKTEEIVEKTFIMNYSKYYRLAYSYVHNEADAVDIVQEAAYRAILKSDSLKNASFADTWICRIVINEAYSVLRKKKTEDLEAEENSIVQEDRYEDIDLKNAIENLDAEDKTVIILRYYEDKKLEEIAEIMEMNLSTVKSRLYRVLDKLRLVLAD
jgi:RNA polymerase sigma-70 factor (ECF subfamily)